MGIPKLSGYTFIIFLVASVFLGVPSIFSYSSSTWGQQTLHRMTLREKIGQLCVVAISFSPEQKESLASTNKIMKFPLMNRSYVEDLIKNYHVGGIIFLRKGSVYDQVLVTNELQALSKTPLLVMEDLEWGLAMRLDNTIKFPRNLTLGALQNRQLVYDIAYEIGRQCKAIGVHMNLAPVVDVNNNAANPVINDRSFGQNKENVAIMGALYMRGLQDAGILACAKHFPGHGDTSVDSHVRVPCLAHSKKRLQALELYPFKRLIDQGVDAVMNGHLKVSSYDSCNIATLSYPIVTDLLQKKLGFKGLILTDALNMGAVSSYTPEELAVKAFCAGNDLLVVPLDIPKTIAGIEAAVKSGRIDEQEIDRRVLKILQTKEALKLPQNRFVETETLQNTLNTADAYYLKKQAYQEAITVIDPAQSMTHIPSKILQNDIGLVQIGGKKNSAFAQTLCGKVRCNIDYISARMNQQRVQQELQKMERFATVIVALFDMQKLAKKKFGITSGTLEFLEILRHQGKKIILVIFGSPYSLKLFNKKDAIVMAYEDDPDAQEAAAEVVLGTRRATGKLPVTW